MEINIGKLPKYRLFEIAAIFFALSGIITGAATKVLVKEPQIYMWNVTIVLLLSGFVFIMVSLFFRAHIHRSAPGAK